jgi:spore germination protein YaaH
MRDIVYKRRIVPASPISKPVLISPPKAPPSTLARGLENGIVAVSDSLSWLKQMLDPEKKPDIVRQPYAERFEKSTFKKKKDVQKKITHSIHASAKESIRHLKTPLGKMAAAHTLALLLVIVYVARTHTESPVFQPKSLAQTVEGAPLRKYLPNPSPLPSPQPFNEQLADIPKKTLPLNSWVTPWTIDEVGQHFKDYSTLSAFWLTVQPDGFSMAPKADWTAWTKFRKTHVYDSQKYYLTVTGDPNDVYKALADPSIADKHISNLLLLTDLHGFDGIDLDYEGLGIENRDNFTAFLRKVAGAFHAHNKLVSVSLEARIANQVPLDWRNVSSLADQVRIMAYDYHSKQTPFPGPITPIGWLQEILEYATNTISPDKLSIALGNYGYDWTKPEKGGTSWNGNGVSYDYSKALSDKYKNPITRASLIDDRGYDTGSVPTFTYSDEEGKQHSVWFEDSQSLQAKIALINTYKVGGGIFFWSVGFGDKTFWDKQVITK